MDRLAALKRRLAALLLAGIAPAALACGYCVEDKIAATYDHAVVVRALDQKHHVVFFHIDGSLMPGGDTRRTLEAAAESTVGVDKGSVRVSVEALTISFAFDPERTSLVKVQSALERKLAARKLSLMPLRVMDRLSELKTVQR
jgi:hypothetical protein